MFFSNKKPNKNAEQSTEQEINWYTFLTFRQVFILTYTLSNNFCLFPGNNKLFQGLKERGILFLSLHPINRLLRT